MGSSRSSEGELPNPLVLAWMHTFISDPRLRDYLIGFSLAARTALNRRDEQIAKIEDEYEREAEKLSAALQSDLRRLAKQIVDEHSVPQTPD